MMERRRLWRWKFWILLVIYLFLGCLVAQGAIVPGGQIQTDTIWMVTESPYLIEDDLIIDSGVTLTIEPGVEVRFANVNKDGGESNRAELMVYGTLRAVGNLNYPIRFTAEEETVDMGSWGGIYLYEAGSQLSYVQIDRATTALVISKGAILEWSKIIHNLQTGVQVAETANVNLIGNEFTYNRVGLFLSGIGKVQENRFQSNSYGMLVQGVENMTLQSNSFESNTYGIYLEQIGMGNKILNSSVSGNDYGIYLDSDHSPVVNFCDIYNNELYDFFHLGSEDVQASYNWWGTSDSTIIDSFIFDQSDNESSVRYGYVLYDPFLKASALAPTVLNLVSDPQAIGEGTLTVTITFSKDMNRIIEPTIRYGLFEPYTAYVVDPIDGQWLSSTQYRFMVNVDSTVEEGLYRFNIQHGESLDGQQLKSNISYTFLVDRTPPTVFTGVDYFAFSPNGDGVQEQLEAALFFDEMATFSYSIYHEGQLVVGPLSSLEFNNETVIRWDGLGHSGLKVTEGSYDLQLVLKDQAGNETNTPILLPILVDCTPPVLEVNPFEGIQTTNPEIFGRVEDQTTPVTYISYRKLDEMEWTTLTQFGGNENGLLYIWNVLKLEEGQYELKIQVEDLAGNLNQQVLPVDLDLQEPQILINTPLPEQHLMEEVVFSGQLMDSFLQDWRLELEVNDLWVLLTSGTKGIQGEIFRLDLSDYEDGLYRYRIVATDQVGHQSSQLQTYYVDNHTPPEISGKNVMPQRFSPNGDGRKDQVRFQFNFSEESHWQLDIQNQIDQVVRSYYGTGPLASINWDGCKEDGTFLADGVYSYYLTYQDQVGHEGEPELGQVFIDTIAPQLSLSPWPNLTNQETVLLEGEAVDYDQLTINEQLILAENGHFSINKDLTEGLNQYQVIAEDQAGNQMLILVEIILDTLAPIFRFDSAKELTNQEETRIVGEIEEANLLHSAVILTNTIGTKELTLELTPDQAFDLQILLTEGENQLSFSAVDGAGNRTDTELVVQYLPTIAEIYLLQPTKPYLSKPSSEMILQVEKGTAAVDPETILVQLDGQTVPYTWDETTHQIYCQLEGLAEGNHYFETKIKNNLGELGSGLAVNLIVDLTDPLLQITTPIDQAILDGWDGKVIIDGVVEDQYLDSLAIHLKSQFGEDNLLALLNLEGETHYEGTFATTEVADLPNGDYYLEVRVQDQSGRVAIDTLEVEVRNTGLIQGQVFGDLEQILEPILYLVVGNQIQIEFAFDPMTGGFSQRVPVGSYDLVLMPWGYDPVVLSDLEIEVGQTYNGLDLLFDVILILTIEGDKQLLALPIQINTAPTEANLIFEGYDGKDYYSITDWSQLQPGVGYWITGSEEMHLNLDGQPVLKEEYRVGLEKGWNLISSPYYYPYPLEGLGFILEGKLYDLVQAQQGNLIDGGIWNYQHWYREVSQLEPWMGYWLYTNKSGQVVFSPDDVILPYQHNKSEVKFLSDLIQDPEWKVQIRAKLGQAMDVENHLGTAWIATSGFDPKLDFREPPGYSPYVSLYFLEPDGEKLTRSYQAPVQGLRGERSWEMVVEGDQSGWVQLGWNLEPDSTLSLDLKDLTTGEAYNMFKQTNYEFYYQQGKERKFVVTAKKGQFEIKKVFNYPNPFSPDYSTDRGKGTRIRYLLTHDAEVKLEILDVMGRLVKRFPSAKEGDLGGSEGWNEIYWNGYNGQGKPIANGSYILKVTATQGKNHQVKMARMAVINRR